MNWHQIKRFNFTYAIPGGAWLEDASGFRNWESFTTIQRHLGQIWIDRQRAKQGWMTGCWVDVTDCHICGKQILSPQLHPCPQ